MPENCVTVATGCIAMFSSALSSPLPLNELAASKNTVFCCVNSLEELLAGSIISSLRLKNSVCPQASEELLAGSTISSSEISLLESKNLYLYERVHCW